MFHSSAGSRVGIWSWGVSLGTFTKRGRRCWSFSENVIFGKRRVSVFWAYTPGSDYTTLPAPSPPSGIVGPGFSFLKLEWSLLSSFIHFSFAIFFFSQNLILFFSYFGQRDKNEEALLLAQLSAEKPHFSHCLEWLLFTVFDAEISRYPIPINLYNVSLFFVIYT